MDIYTISQKFKNQSYTAENLRADIADGNINSQDGFGWTLLHHAAASNRVDLIDCLKELGADETITSDQNEAPKKLAARFNNKDAYSMLAGEELTRETKEHAKDDFKGALAEEKAKSHSAALGRQTRIGHDGRF